MAKDITDSSIPKDVLAGLRGVTSPDVPNYGPVGSAEVPTPATVEEAALHYEQRNSAGAAHLPANNNEPSTVVEIKPVVFGVSEAMQLIAEIERLDGDARSELADELRNLKQYVDAAIKGQKKGDVPNLGDIAAKVNVAKTDAAGKAESPEGKFNKAWSAIDRASKEITKDLHELDHLKTKEEKAREKELQEELEKKKAEYERICSDPNATEEQKIKAQLAMLHAQKELTAQQEGTTVRIENDPHTSPEDKKKAEAIHTKIEELKKMQDKLLRLEEEKLKSLGATSEELEQKMVVLKESDEKIIKGLLEKDDPLNDIKDNLKLAAEALLKAEENNPKILPTNSPNAGASDFDLAGIAGPIQVTEKFAVAHASIVDEKVASSTPADDFSVTIAAVTPRR